MDWHFKVLVCPSFLLFKSLPTLTHFQVESLNASMPKPVVFRVCQKKKMHSSHLFWKHRDLFVMCSALACSKLSATASP